MPPYRLGFLITLVSYLPIPKRVNISTIPKPTLWSAKIVVRVIRRKILGVGDFKLFRHVLHCKELIWEHLDPSMGFISLDLQLIIILLPFYFAIIALEMPKDGCMHPTRSWSQEQSNLGFLKIKATCFCFHLVAIMASCFNQDLSQCNNKS